jgi:allophanate hydrolase
MTLLAVVGAHLGGQPLNHQLTDRGATLVRTTTTASCYRLFALDTEPPKPGLVRVAPADPAAGEVEVEVWELDDAAFGSFVAAVPPPLCIGTVLLADGSSVMGFLCEPVALDGAPDITASGGWRAHLG